MVLSVVIPGTASMLPAERMSGAGGGAGDNLGKPPTHADCTEPSPNWSMFKFLCPLISRDVERLLMLMPRGRAFRRAADGLFAWTVPPRLRGDDGQREVVSQSWPVLPVLTGEQCDDLGRESPEHDSGRLRDARDVSLPNHHRILAKMEDGGDDGTPAAAACGHSKGQHEVIWTLVNSFLCSAQ
ncbi:unnamed protein product [Pleuronectes platessa]|uniref:Uncharacterized protein n=1 Tax=Pleuronectes platessa TaxID=8262 RepID=A0A9N7U5J0_PLEPL|nr:unnamed protein product [Pleuronectes platessa]